MDKEEVRRIVSKQFKLVRTEFDYSQEEMAEILGISKKLLIQIEKERKIASWSNVVALCALFQNSNILQNELGGDPLEVVKTIAHTQYDWRKPKTLGGKVWWIEKEKKNGFVIQQNVISKHYRIIDQERRRWYSSFDKDFIYQQFEKLTNTPSE